MAHLKIVAALLAMFLFAAAGAWAVTSAFPGVQTSLPFFYQSAANRFATRQALSSGSYTFTYAAFNSTPICIAIPEGILALGLISVAPTTTSCTVTSAVGADSRTVDIVVIGNPN
jgi:hypothetical protein